MPDEHEAIRRELSRLEQTLTGMSLNLPPAELVVPRTDTAYADGTMVPLLHRTVTQTSSGLIVPTDSVADAYPIDLMATYITGEDISGRAMSLDEARGLLSRAPRAAAIVFCATLMRALNAPTTDVRALESQLVDEWFAPEARPRIRSLLSANRRLITEQGALQLLKRALLWCSDDETAEWRLSDLVISYFAISDGFGQLAGAEEAPSLDEHAQRSLAAEVFSNQWFNAPRDLVGSFARHSFRWADSPEVDVQPRQLYREATGVELSVVEDLALALWAIAMGGQVVVTIGALAGSTGYSEADVEAALGLISADTDQLRALVEEHEGREGLEWSFSAFERYPLISDGDARVIYAPNLLIRRVFSWTSTFDVRAALGARATPFIQLMQQRSEAQVRAAFDGMFPDSPTQRVYSEAEQASAYGTAKRAPKTADMAIDDVESWLIVEITSTMPRREAIVGVDAEAFLEDLDKLRAKVRQIDSSISLIRADETALTGHATRPRRFLPVLVCTEGFPVNPITMSELERRCDAESLLQGDDVQGLRLLTHEDLEAAEALMETHGVSLSALLEDHANSSLRAMDLRSYILASRNPMRLRPTRLDEATDAAFESLMSRVGRDQSDDAATP